MPTETHRHCGIIFSRDAKRRLVRTYRLTPTEAGRHLALILNLRRQHQRGNEVKRTWEGVGGDAERDEEDKPDCSGESEKQGDAG